MKINHSQNDKIEYKGTKMSSGISDNVIETLISQVKSRESEASKILSDFVGKNINFEKIQHGIYKYNDYYIFNGLKTYFENNIRGYQVAEKSQITCAPTLIKSLELPNQEILAIIKLKGGAGKLYSFEEKLSEMDLLQRVEILNDFKRMVNSDYINLDAINSIEDWRVTEDNKLVILNWENLAKVVDSNEKLQILDKVKRMIRINDDIIPNVYNIY